MENLAPQSTPESESPGGAPAPVEQAAPRRSEGGSSWFRGVIDAIRGPASDAPQDAEGAEGSGDGAAEQPFRVYQTEDEHRAAIQSEVDRRESVRAQRAREDAEREREREIAQLEADRIKAREEGDRWTADEYQERIDLIKNGVAQDRVSSQALAQFGAEIRARVDHAVLDPLFADLPPDMATAVLHAAAVKGPDGKLLIDPRDGLPVGIVDDDSRAAAVKGAIKAIRKHEYDRARDSLRKDPAFRKEVLTGFKPSDEDEQPELIPAAQGVAGPRNMNIFLRSGRRTPGQPSVISTTTNGLS